MKRIYILLLLITASCVSSGNPEYFSNGNLIESTIHCRLPFKAFETKFLSKSSNPNSSSEGRLTFQDPFNTLQLRSFINTALDRFPQNTTIASNAMIEYTEITEPAGISNIIFDITLGLIPFRTERSSMIKLMIVNAGKVTFLREVKANWTVHLWVLGGILGLPLLEKSIENRQKEIIERLLPILIDKANERFNKDCL
ncbi:hypothetical protein EHQ53_00975 [Leptospira langatensis]|uniref:Lipoprotein n=1 Tax=Leptospira langatensis TaxID=2484983 RepID=A0A5F1ZYV9_9LEPT|nr:hypothetical protein [Leptospira langatensis]TGJ98330.1 hypothetical protein EHO57_17120 [Leptospira langatensis]TGL43243.1 hypothetical protein EHQ53_00975 [Leptospira langatensis]